MKKTIILSLLVFATSIFANCISGKSGSDYTRGETRKAMDVQFAKVKKVRSVKIEGTKSQIGATTGAVVGAIAGNKLGKGNDNAIATILGGVAGGVAGSAIEEGATRQDGVELTLKLDNGKTIVIVQAVDKETFNIGDEVRIIKEENGITRVSH